MKDMYFGPKEYIPEICKIARRVGNHFECGMNCPQINQKEQYICPCFGRSGYGWIPVDEEKIQSMIAEVKRWNDCRTRIPNEDNWSLKGIKYFRIGKFDLLIEQFGQNEVPTVREEMLKLFNNGERIGFNEDYGVGNIITNEDGTFTVEKFYYGTRSTPVENGTIDDVLEFLWEFWGNSEPFSYTKVGYPELDEFRGLATKVNSQ